MDLNETDDDLNDNDLHETTTNDSDFNAEEEYRQKTIREIEPERTRGAAIKKNDDGTCCRYKSVRHQHRAISPTPRSADFEQSFITDLKSKGVIVGKTIGEGSYSKVKKVFVSRLNTQAAMKIVSRHRVQTDFLNKFLPREVHILKNISHPNITKMLDIIYLRGKICLVIELARHGDLLGHIQRHRRIQERNAKIMFRQIVSAVQYLHTRGYFHRDLKCENILLHDNLTVKISDFGFAREWSDANRLCKTFCGSSAYASPEILRGMPYDPHDSDIWSLGVVLFIMIIGSMPYDDSNISKMLTLMDDENVPFPASMISNEVRHLIQSILRKEPVERATISQILHHPWIKAIC